MIDIEYSVDQLYYYHYNYHYHWHYYYYHHRYLAQDPVPEISCCSSEDKTDKMFIINAPI